MNWYSIVKVSIKKKHDALFHMDGFATTIQHNFESSVQ